MKMKNTNFWTIFMAFLLLSFVFGGSAVLFGILPIPGGQKINLADNNDSPSNSESVNKTDLDAFYYVINKSREDGIHNITRIRTSVEGDTLVVRHGIDRGSSNPRADAVGVVSAAFVGAVKSGWDIERMDGYLVSADGTVVMTYYVERAWARSVARDRMSPEMYANLIHSTQDVKQPTVTAPG